jgi:DNA invertase Pin-like site-specific DNA recombinase
VKRPQLEAMLSFVCEGDIIIVHSLDRLARNLDNLRKIVKDLTDRGVKIEFKKEKLTFTGADSPMSNLLLLAIGAYAEFERALIRERQSEGIAIAKKKGLMKGRKNSLNQEQVKELQQKVAEGIPKARVAREFKITRQTLYRYLKEVFLDPLTP